MAFGISRSKQVVFGEAAATGAGRSGSFRPEIRAPLPQVLVFPGNMAQPYSLLQGFSSHFDIRVPSSPGGGWAATPGVQRARPEGTLPDGGAWRERRSLVTLYPLIGSLRCQSHYFIRGNRIVWAPKWSKGEIGEGRRSD